MDRHPDAECPICLETFVRKCRTDVCSHNFCFECLKKWSTLNPKCPLCKQSFRKILCDHSNQVIHEVILLPAFLPNPVNPIHGLMNPLAIRDSWSHLAPENGQRTPGNGSSAVASSNPVLVEVLSVPPDNDLDSPGFTVAVWSFNPRELERDAQSDPR